MYVIIDSGSTKTEMLVHGRTGNESLNFPGINPFYQTKEEIRNMLEKETSGHPSRENATNVFFYGAGCAFPEKRACVRNALKEVFTQAEIEVENDLLAAARALFQTERGIACILGTGSNSCLYNGKAIEQNVPPLGFILGDEGSGAVIGKHFVSDCLKKQMPEELAEAFLEQQQTTMQEVMDNVYKRPFPNRYLASVCRFIYGFKETEYVQNLLHDCFSDFFVRNILQYPIHGEQLGVVGSIAHYFRDELAAAAHEQGFTIAKIMKQPMEGLVEYHTNKQKNN